jgi:hypothetical protein
MKRFIVLLFAFFAVTVTQTQAQNTQDTENFVISVSGKIGGAITYAELSGQQVLVDREGYEVEEFTLVCMLNGNDLWEGHAIGNQFLQSWDPVLQALTSGQNIFLENIKIRGLDGSLRVIDSVQFTFQ